MSGASGTLVFSHANGFPAGTYRSLFELWRASGWRVVAVDRFGHDPAYPVTSNWPHLRDQLIDFVDAEASGQGPVFLVGHSLGGYLSLLAACRRRNLAQGVVLLDSPVVAGWRAHSVQVAKVTGLIRRVSPGRVSRTRRHHWPSAQAALQHFAARSVFARWAPEVLQDYVQSGTEPDSVHSGVCLSFDRSVETRIYNSLPHHFGALLKRHPPTCPVYYLGGTRSAEGRQVGLAMTRALTQGRIGWIEGTHLYPMESPAQTAQAVLSAIASLQAESAAAPGP